MQERGVVVPRYEYKCIKCENVLEKTKPMSEVSKPEKCPICSAKAYWIPSVAGLIVIN